MFEKKYTLVQDAKQVSAEILQNAVSIYDGWYSNAPSIDWEDLLWRLDGMELADGTSLDLGMDMPTPAIQKIQNHVRKLRRES